MCIKPLADRRRKTLPKTRGHVKNNCIYVSTSSKIVSQSPNPNVLVLGPESQVVGMNELCEGLKLAHLNIRSLRNTAHFLQLKELVRTNRIDVLTISETWLNTTVTNKKLEIDGYKLHRLDRLYKKGGGVCAYVRKNIKSSVIKELTLISDTSFHQLWINLQYKKTKSLLACVCYRPPDCPLDCFENSLKPQYVHALSMRKSIIILGDLNCNMLDTTSREFKSLTEMTSELNLKKIIESPTRITDISQSLIDVILVSSPNTVRDSGVLNCTISDHLLVYVTLKLKPTKPAPTYITVRSYRNYDPELFAADLASKSERLLSVFSVNDINEKLKIFDEVLQTTLDSHAPIKTLKVSGRPCPFVTPEIKELMSKRDRLHGLFLKTRSYSDWCNFKAARNAVKTELIKAQRNHVHNEVMKHKKNTGSLWKIIKDTVAYKEKETVVYSKDPKIVAEEFNQFFSSVGENTAIAACQLLQDNNTYPDISPTTAFNRNYPVYESEMFHFDPVSCSEVKNIITSMPTNKAPGKDKVNMRIIKDCLPVILGPLTDIINASLTSSEFPQSWKEAEVIPLIKRVIMNCHPTIVPFPYL